MNVSDLKSQHFLGAFTSSVFMVWTDIQIVPPLEPLNYDGKTEDH